MSRTYLDIPIILWGALVGGIIFGLSGLLYVGLSAQSKPYTVYRIPRGCLYVVGTAQSTLAAVYVPDTEQGPCDVGTTPVR